MRDRDIRAALRTKLEAEHADGALILDELGLCQGEARVDIAVINGSINGFEIKSERDTLDRLPGQASVYGRTLDSVTIVVGQCHLKMIEDRIPAWWGIFEAIADDDVVHLNEVRPASINPSVELFAVAQLLWREEAWDILVERGLHTGLATKPRRALWARLAENLSRDELSAVVRSKLTNRGGWRVAQEPS